MNSLVTNKFLYTEKQMADELGIGIRTIYSWRTVYGLKGSKVGNKWVHTTKQISDFFDRYEGKDISLVKKQKRLTDEISL